MSGDGRIVRSAAAQGTSGFRAGQRFVGVGLVWLTLLATAAHAESADTRLPSVGVGGGVMVARWYAGRRDSEAGSYVPRDSHP